MSSSSPTINSSSNRLPGGTSLYSLLGLPFPFGGSSLDIRRAYRRAALLHHPDRNCSPSTTATTEEESTAGASPSSPATGVQVPFHVLHRAATLLLDPARRAEYDGWFQAGGGGDGLSSGRVRRVDVGDERTFMVVLKMPWELWGRSISDQKNTDTGLMRNLLAETISSINNSNVANDDDSIDNVADSLSTMFKFTEGSEWEDVADTRGSALNVLYYQKDEDGGVCGKESSSDTDGVVSQILLGKASSAPSQMNHDVDANQPEWVDHADMFILAQEEATSGTQNVADEQSNATVVDTAAWARPDVALVMCRLECRCSGAYTVELPYLHLLLAEVAKTPRQLAYIIRKHVILLLIHQLNTSSSSSQGCLILKHLVSISRNSGDGNQQRSPTLLGLCDALSVCLHDYINAVSTTTTSTIATATSLTVSGLHTEMLVAGKTSSNMRKEVCSMCSLVMGLHSVPEVSVVNVGGGAGAPTTSTTTTSKPPTSADDDSLFVGLFPRGM